MLFGKQRCAAKSLNLTEDATEREFRVLERKLGTHLGTRTKSEGKTSFLGGLRALRKALEVNYLQSGGGGRI